MDAQFWLGLVIGAVVSTLLWFFKPEWLRRRVGLDPKPPYQVAGIDQGLLQRDPVIGPTLPPSDCLSWSLESQVPLRLQRGQKRFLTPDGRHCVYVRRDYQGEETLVLMHKP
jgi:hypothetical protein